MTNSLQARHSSEAPRSSATSSWSSVRWKEATFMRAASSQLAEDSDDAADDLDVRCIDRLHRRVLRLQPNPVCLAIEGLDRRLVGRLVVASQRDDDLTVPGFLCTLHDHEVAVEDAPADHCT